MRPGRCSRRRGLAWPLLAWASALVQPTLPALVPALIPALLPTPALAQAARPAPPDAAIARAVRQVVEAQLGAFAIGDADAAFAHAAPAIRQQFGSAQRFMAMVREGYAMLLSPRSVSFFVPELEASDAGGPSAVVQAVGVVDRAGRAWRATYQLERQGDGQWRIAGCVVVADGMRAAT